MLLKNKIKKRKSVAYWKEITKKLKANILRAKSTDRWIQLHKRNNFLQKAYNDYCNKSLAYKERGFKEVPIYTILKLSQWYADQKPIRRDMIRRHKSFCCPFSGEVLDMSDSFIVCNRVVSSTGLQMMIDKKGLGVIGGINT